MIIWVAAVGGGSFWFCIRAAAVFDGPGLMNIEGDRTGVGNSFKMA